MSPITDMPLSDEVADFIEKGLHGDMTEKDLEEWCDNNLDDVTMIYEKYGHSYMSYRDAEITLFFAKTLYANKVSNVHEKVSQFVVKLDD
jgi:hypothetical protein|tara:strand:- start:320 stop:589 length:270 start_codon:yes stop_codon:yes gene_type:complete